MAESKDAFDRIDSLANSVDELKRQVAAITRSKTLKAEVLDDLFEGNGSLARVYAVVSGSMTQEEISAAYSARWATSISTGGLSGKLTVLGKMDLVRPSAVRVAGKLVYSTTSYATGLNLGKQFESRLKSLGGGAKR